MKRLMALALGLAIAVAAPPTLAKTEPRQGGTLTIPIIITAFTKAFNPYVDPKEIVSGLLFEPLAFINTFQDNEVDYRLAEDYKYADDRKSITYTLRNNLKWSDGEPLDADDVVYTFKLARKVPVYDLAGLWSSGRITDVVRVSDRKIRFELARPDSTIHWAINRYMPLPEHIWKKANDPATFTNPEGIGSGPVTEIKYVRAQQMEICRNPHYFQTNKPYIDCLKYRAFNDNGQIQPALMRDEIDWGSNFVADIDSTYVAPDPEHHHYWYPPNDAVNLYLNTKRKPFDNLKFRQAISVAIDRDAIVDLAAYGYPTVNHFPGGIGAYFKEYMDPAVTEKYGWLGQYDPERAKQLLDEAGYVDTNDDGYREMPDGSELSFGLRVVNGWTDWVQVVQMITEYLAKVGVRSHVNAVEWGVYETSLKSGDYDAAINWSLLQTHPIQTFKEYFHTSRIGQISFASHGVHSKRIDKLIDDFGTLETDAERQDTLRKLEMFTAENMPFIPLFSNATWFQYSTSRFVGWPSAKNPYVHPTYYKVGKKTLILNNVHKK